MPFKRYNSSNGYRFRTGYIGGVGELTWDSTNGLRLHDGSTSGGKVVATFNDDGTITLPTLNTTNWEDGTLTGPTLQIGNDPTVNEIVITGTTPTNDYSSARRLIIQGQAGYGGENNSKGEGGDVYIWAGIGGEGGSIDPKGDGGDVKLRGGTGGNEGGYIRLESGDAEADNGQGGFLDLNAGSANNSGGLGGNVDIRAGLGANIGGVVSIHTALSSTFTSQWTFGNDGTTTLPGAVIQGTVAKTVTTTPLYLGDSTFATPLVDGNYGPFTLSGIVFTVQVLSGSPIYTITSVPDNVSFTKTQVIGTLDSDDLGGAPGETKNIDVSELVPTVLDLTKSINKLTDGGYSLANGAEGQIMYLVRQTGSNEGDIRLTVGNARVDGSTYTNYTFVPFTASTSLDIAMLIFTDGRWQSDNGLWGS